MKSKTYLQGEARWARDKAAKAQRTLDDLADPRELRLLRDRLDIKARRVRYELREALRERGKVHDRLPEYVASLEADRDRWQQLAEEYEKRIADTEYDALFGSEGASDE